MVLLLIAYWLSFIALVVERETVCISVLVMIIMMLLLLLVLLTVNIISTSSSNSISIQSLALGVASTNDVNEQMIRLLTFGHMQAVTGIATVNKRKGFHHN
jgi:hypothetical protein